MDSNGQPLIPATCLALHQDRIVDGSSTDIMGFCKLQNSNIDSIRIEYLGYQPFLVRVDKISGHNRLQIELVERNFAKYLFQDEIVVIKNRNKIKIRTFNRDKVFQGQ